MRRLPRLALVLAPVLIGGAARADEFTDTLDSARSAYESGDVKAAGEDLAYATKLLGSQKAAGLAKFLPPAPAGWTRTDEPAEDAGLGMAILGGGTSAAASYTDGTTEAKITLTADSPMVSGLGAVFSGVSSLAGGKPLRIQRVEFGEMDGELRGVVDGRVMVSVGGDASTEVKTGLLEAMDFNALADY